MNVRATLVGLCLAVIGIEGMAQSWDADIVSNAKQRAAQAQGNGATALMLAEMFARAERAKRSGVVLLEYSKLHKSMGMLPQDSDAKLYSAFVEIVAPDGTTHVEQVWITPEEAERMKMEAAGTSAQEVAKGLDVMARGMLATGEALRRGIGESPFAGMLNPQSGLEVLNESDGKTHNEKCVTYLRRQQEFAGTATNAAQRDNVMARQLGVVTVEGLPIGYDPSVAMLAPACLYAAMAHKLNEPTETYKAIRNRGIEQLNRRLNLKGEERIEGYPTQLITADGLSIKQKTEDGKEVTIERVHVWMDPNHLVRRKVRMEGVMMEDGKRQPIFIERVNRDFRRVDNSSLYEPYSEVMTAGGVLDDKQMKEMAQAQKELEKFERELASMPAAQRQMMERMVGPQIEQMRKMTSTGAVSAEIVTRKITINPDLSDDGAMYRLFSSQGGSPGSAGGAALPAGANGVALVQLIQTNLGKLGFQPGPATGELTDATRAAITRYQTARAMPVTGQPSPALASALQDEVNRR